MLEMTSDALTIAGTHVTTNIALTCDREFILLICPYDLERYVIT